MLTFLRRKMKTIMIAVAVIFAASMFYGIAASRGGGGGRPSKDILAKVNGQKVDPFQFREMQNRLLRQAGGEVKPQDLAFIQNLALRQTIDFTVILEQAKRKVRVSNREVDLAVENVMQKENITSQRQLEQILKRTGLNLRKLREMMKNEMLVQRLINNIKAEVEVSPDDLREIRASHILVTSEAMAHYLMARLEQGEKFAALAKEYSKDHGSAAAGGDLGYFTTGMMVEPFEKAAFKTKVGEIGEIARSSFGYHIIKVTDSRLRKFGQGVEDVEKAALQHKQNQVFQKWFSEIRSQTKVEVINPTFKAHDLRFRGMMAEAVLGYQEAIALEPVNPLLHIYLGDVYAALGKNELAIDEYETAISIDGGNPEFYIILAEFYKKIGDKKEAVMQYKRASLVSGDNKAMHGRLLNIFEELKAWEQYRREKNEIARIEKKEAFEKELRETEEGTGESVLEFK